MHQPYPDEPRDGRQRYPGASRRPAQPDRYRRDGDEPDYWRDGEWFRSQPRPTAAEPRPTTIESRPTTIESRPTTIERRPTALEPRPTAAESRPTTIERRPRPVEPRPRPAEPAPRAVDLLATAVDLPALQERTQGRNWMLIAGTVLFLIDTILLADGFVQPVALGSRVLVMFVWLVSLAAIGLLWLRIAPGQVARLRGVWARLRTAPQRRHA